MTSLTGFRRDPIGVELGVLVQRDGMGGMGGTEYMPTVATVMFANKKVERGTALRGVTSR